MTEIMAPAELLTRSGRATQRRQYLRIAAILMAAVVAQLALVAAFTGAMSNPTLRHAEVGVVAPAAPTAARLSLPPMPGISYQVLFDRSTAERLVRDGDLPAAVVLGEHTEALYVAGAAGPALVSALTQQITTQAEQANRPLTTLDLRPLPTSDPRGFGTFLLVIGWVIDGYLGATLLTRALGAAARTRRGTLRLLSWTLAYSLASAVVGVTLIDPIMGVVIGHPAQLIGAGTLNVLAVGTFTAALLSLLGLPGLILAIGALVILGNPTSGGAIPPQMLAGGWRFLAHILPTNAGVSLTRTLAYYDGHQLGHPLTVLLTYAGGSTLLLIALAARRATVRHPASTPEHSSIQTSA